MMKNFGDLEQALLAFIVKEYSKVSKNTLGRTVIQKLCYHAKMKGIPFQYSFEIYHYGPFSQAIYGDMDMLITSGIVHDENPDPEVSRYVPTEQLDQYLKKNESLIKPYLEDLSKLIVLFSEVGPREMELLSTVHYCFKSHKDFFKKTPSYKEVLGSVKEIKGSKFSDEDIDWAYKALRDNNLLVISFF